MSLIDYYIQVFKGIVAAAENMGKIAGSLNIPPHKRHGCMYPQIWRWYTAYHAISARTQDLKMVVSGDSRTKPPKSHTVFILVLPRLLASAAVAVLHVVQRTPSQPPSEYVITISL